MKDIYALCEEKTEVSKILKVVAKWTAIFTIGSLGTYYRRLTIDQLANKLSMNLRHQYYKVLLQKRISLFAEQNSGNLSHQLGHDIYQISQTVVFEFSSILRGAAFFTGGLGYLFYTSVPLTLVTILPISALALVSKHYGAILKKEREKMSDISRFTQGYTRERISQIKTVKLFTAEGFELKKYKELLDKLYGQAINVAGYSAIHHGLMEGLGQNALLWCIGYGAYLVSIDSGLSIGKLTAFAMYSMYSGLGFRLLSTGYTEMKKVSGIYKLINQNAMLPDVETVSFDSEKVPTSVFNQGTPYIQFRNLTFKYPTRDHLVFDNISFDIKAGEIIGIIGQSGSGKSSIFNLITHLYNPTAGEILINGVNILEKPAWWPRQMISIVSQETLLFTGSILDNIKYSDPQASEEAIIDACKKADAYDFIMEMPDNFNTFVGEQGYALSGGQKQRILIARALLKKPNIFLFDEATSALDASTEGYFQDVIEKEFKGKGYTVIIISHRVRSLKNVCDRIMLIDEGKIIALDTFEQLETHPEFKLLL
ncbi:hypothetical protein SteCoe_9258 [Stentor coeruleus]|uniref:Uncharacterized protein n=1 Tax=Stentor coeruleus TaxID=5963 RepID=A0A1R2CIE0_9CILI|nr:hypothetical protein SteCoe_9258 [Stentor coeruleus]